MSETPISPLRQRMLEDMNMRRPAVFDGLSERTALNLLPAYHSLGGAKAAASMPIGRVRVGVFITPVAGQSATGRPVWSAIRSRQEIAFRR